MHENLERDGESILEGLMQRVQLKSSSKIFKRKFTERTKRDEMREGKKKRKGGELEDEALVIY